MKPSIAGWTLNPKIDYGGMKYRLFIFDFDGTLADTFPWFAGVINRVAEKYRFRRVTEEDKPMLRSWNATEIMDFLGIPAWKAPFIAAEFRKLMSRDIHTIALFEGVNGLLAKLQENSTEIAVVSSNSKKNIMHILKRHQIGEIDFLKCGVSVMGKTSKLRDVLHRSGTPKGDVIYIGDEIRDIRAAREIGIDAGAVSWGYTDVEALKAEKPDQVYFLVNDVYEQNI